jgi:hypothetical protein
LNFSNKGAGIRMVKILSEIVLFLFIHIHNSIITKTLLDDDKSENIFDIIYLSRNLRQSRTVEVEEISSSLKVHGLTNHSKRKKKCPKELLSVYLLLVLWFCL